MPIQGIVFQDEKLGQLLKEGGMAVMPTDTLYGVVGSALNERTVERIYKLRKRSPEKPCIILINDWADVQKFGISVPHLPKFDRPTSVILDCLDSKYEYLHRGTKTLAFRVPKISELQNLLHKTGPLIAPSANMEGGLPAKNIEEAKNYFGQQVDLYIDAGEINGQPSKVIKLSIDGSITSVRA